MSTKNEKEEGVLFRKCTLENIDKNDEYKFEEQYVNEDEITVNNNKIEKGSIALSRKTILKYQKATINEDDSVNFIMDKDGVNVNVTANNNVVIGRIRKVDLSYLHPFVVAERTNIFKTKILQLNANVSDASGITIVIFVK